MNKAHYTDEHKSSVGAQLLASIKFLGTMLRADNEASELTLDWAIGSQSGDVPELKQPLLMRF